MFKQKFAQKIKEIRKSRKLTQEQLAELVGVDFRYISLIENAKSFPSCELIEKLSSVLNISYKDMFDFEEKLSRKEIENRITELFKSLDDRNIGILYNFAKNLL